MVSTTYSGELQSVWSSKIHKKNIEKQIVPYMKHHAVIEFEITLHICCRYEAKAVSLKNDRSKDSWFWKWRIWSIGWGWHASRSNTCMGSWGAWSKLSFLQLTPQMMKFLCLFYKQNLIKNWSKKYLTSKNEWKESNLKKSDYDRKFDACGCYLEELENSIRSFWLRN